MNVWTKRLDLARRNLIKMANSKLATDYTRVEHCRMFLNAYHKGPWRAIFALTKYELISMWGTYGWPKWEWFRTRVLRREPDPVLSIAQRVADEEEAINRLRDEL